MTDWKTNCESDDIPDGPVGDLFTQLLDEYDECLARGESAGVAPDSLSALTSRQITLLDEARRCLEAVHRAADHETSRGSDSTPGLTRREDLSPWLDGLTQIGRFRVVRELGRGGHGVVFLAEDPVLRRQVALKLPRPECLLSEAFRRRFVREAQAAARLTHPNIVVTYEVGETGATSYLATAYCSGPTLSQRLRENGPLPAEEAAKVVRDLAEAVDYAHREGVVHRDIKPSNVIFESDAAGEEGSRSPDHSFTPKLADFGLAKLTDPSGTITDSGAIVGTPAYMSPEQAEGRPAGPASDVYSLGVLLYEMVSGKPPLRGSTELETIRLVVTADPVALRRVRPEVSADLDAICLKCLEKRASDRYESAGALAADLGRYLNREGIVARRPGLWERLLRWGRRRPATAAMVCLVGVFLSVLAVGMWMHNAQLRELLEAAERSREIAEEHSYVSQMAIADREWREGHTDEVSRLLSLYEPAEGKADRRGFEWWRLKQSLFEHDGGDVACHSDRILASAFSPDGRTFASGAADGSVVVVDVGTRKRLSAFSVGGVAIAALAVPGDGTVRIVQKDGRFRQWEIANGSLLEETEVGAIADPVCWSMSESGAVGVANRDGLWLIEGQVLRKLGSEVPETQSPLLTVVDSPAGRSLLMLRAGSVPSELQVTLFGWDGTQAETHGYRASLDTEVIALSRDGSMCGIGTSSGEVQFWRTESQWSRSVSLTHPVELLAISDDLRWVVAGAHGGIVDLVEIASGRVARSFRFPASLAGLSVSRENVLAATTADGRVFFASLEEERSELERAFDAPSPPRQALFVSGGRRAAVLRADGRVYVYDLETGARERELGGGIDGTFAITHGRGEDEVLCVSTHDMLIPWNVASDVPVAQASLRTGHPLSSISVHADRSEILVGGHDGWAKILPLSGDAKARGWQIFPFSVDRVVRSPDGGCFFASGPSGLGVWDASDGRRIVELSMQGTDGIPAWSSDGRMLAYCTGGGHLYVWKRETNESLAMPLQLFHFECAAFIDGDSTLMAGSHFGDLCMFETTKFQETTRVSCHEGSLVSVSVSPDETKVMTTGNDGRVRVWDAKSWNLLFELDRPPGAVHSIAFSADSRSVWMSQSRGVRPRVQFMRRPWYILARLAQGIGKDQVTEWDATTGHRSDVLSVPATATTTLVCCSPDGRYVATGRRDDGVDIWNGSTHAHVVTIAASFEGAKERAISQRLVGGVLYDAVAIPTEDLTTGVLSMAFVNGGDQVATLSEDGKLAAWDCATGEEIWAFDKNKSYRQISSTQDGSILAIVKGPEIEILRTADRAILGRLRGQSSSVRSICFSRDGSLLASGGDDRIIRIWDWNRGSQLMTLSGHGAEITSLSFSPDGGRLASGSKDGKVKLWHVGLGQELASLEEHSGPVRGVAFSPDGRYLASGGESKGYGEFFLRDASVGTR